MTTTIITALAGTAVGLALVATITWATAQWLTRFADALQAALYGTDAHGQPRPRCPRCPRPEPAESRPSDCLWHVPDTPAELFEEGR